MSRSYKRDKNGRFASTGGRSAAGGAGRGSAEIAKMMSGRGRQTANPFSSNPHDIQPANAWDSKGVGGRKVQRLQRSALAGLQRPAAAPKRVVATIGRESMVMSKKDTPEQTRAKVIAAAARSRARRNGKK